jgi:dephospho-CoA kinase
VTGRKMVLGLIGGIGAGKSTASRCLAFRGGFSIDCDKLGHVALEQPPVMEQLRARWGNVVQNLDGSANRGAIGKIVFEAPAERGWLEQTVFPVIGELAHAAIEQANTDPAIHFVVLDAAVLLEAGWRNLCDRILYIDAPRELRLKRLAVRSNWTAEQLTAREAAQWPAERKKQAADAVILNDRDLQQLQKRIDHILNSWGWQPETPTG